jgi:oxygen-dependent protoporphyrinogen oxidase
MNVAVLGGGVTGLTAAWRLSGAGHKVRLFEASPRPGGCVRTEAVDGWLVESGPNAVQETPEVAAVIQDLGLGAERIMAAPGAKNRYLVRRGALVALPTPSDVAGLVSTPLLSFASKFKVTSEMTQSPRTRSADVSIAEMVREHFGGEILERFVQPVVGGIYAGDAERLSARHAFPKIWEAEKATGSLVRAGLDESKRRKALGLPPPSLISFRKGLQALTDALASRLPAGTIVLNAEVREILPAARSKWTVKWSAPAGPKEEIFERVVCALPAGGLAQLAIGGAEKRPLSLLSEVEHPPVASVFVGYRRDQVRHPLDGFGALVPLSESLSVLGVVFSSSLFAGRAPEGHVALTVFAGGALQPGIAQLAPAELVKLVCADLQAVLGARGKPAFVRQTLWPGAIPQYNLGYGRFLKAIAECERTFPGLLIGGNARDGISLPDCIKSGASLAKRVS